MRKFIILLALLSCTAFAKEFKCKGVGESWIGPNTNIAVVYTEKDGLVKADYNDAGTTSSSVTIAPKNVATWKENGVQAMGLKSGILVVYLLNKYQATLVFESGYPNDHFVTTELTCD